MLDVEVLVAVCDDIAVLVPVGVLVEVKLKPAVRVLVGDLVLVRLEVAEADGAAPAAARFLGAKSIGYICS